MLVAIGLVTTARRTPKASSTHSPSHIPAQGDDPPALQARAAGTLPVALQDAAAAPIGAQAFALLGGLDASDSSRTMIESVSPGRAVQLGSLSTPLHDAAAAVLGSSIYLFGGGQAASEASIVKLDPLTGHTEPAGDLPQARSDLGAATVAGTAYLIGGFTGQAPLDTILAWRPGSGARVVGRLPEPLRYASVAAAGGRIVIAGGITPHGATRQILSFDPATGRVSSLGDLPQPISHAATAALGRYVYVIGGLGAGENPTRDVVAIDPLTGATAPAGTLPEPLSDAPAMALGGRILVAGGRSSDGVVARVLELVPEHRSAREETTPGKATTSLLRPGSDPSVLPGDVLIADKANNRLLVVTPEGRSVWSFPSPGDLSPGQSFHVPDDAFFSYAGREIIATQEDDFVISAIDFGTGRIVYHYGHPGVPGSGPGYVYNPDDAIMLRDGKIVAADIKNCRLIELRPPLGRLVAQIGATGGCYHDPPLAFGSPNGAFPLSDGGTVVTEINGDWVDIFNSSGRLVSATNPPGFGYPSDTNELRPGVYLSVDYEKPGAIETFNAQGRVLWRYAPTGADALDHPSLALPLPNGDVLANDDYNDRVIVVDPRRNRIVWQYGHTSVSGTGAGYLNIPDGVDLVPPYSLADRFPNARGLLGH